MQQPEIDLFGITYKVKVIEYDEEGTIERIVFYKKVAGTEMVFRRCEILDKSLTDTVKLEALVRHPLTGMLYAPDLESLIVKER